MNAARLREEKTMTTEEDESMTWGDCVVCGKPGATCMTGVGHCDTCRVSSSSEERARIVAFLRARVATLDGFVRDGADEYGRTVHTAQILALHEAARLIELGAEEWTEQ